MLNKYCSILVMILMINVGGVSLAFAGSKTAANIPSAVEAKNDKAKNEGVAKLSKKERKIQKRADEVQKGIEKLGVSKESKVEVKLRDKTKITGHVSDFGDSNFTLVDQTGVSHVINYKNVKQIKGNNLTTGQWVLIGLGAVVIIFLITGIRYLNS